MTEPQWFRKAKIEILILNKDGPCAGVHSLRTGAKSVRYHSAIYILIEEMEAWRGGKGRGRERKREGWRWVSWLWVSFPFIGLAISLVT